jgi:hypothetical protein
MGHYTEIVVNINFRRDTPHSVIDVIGHVFSGIDPTPLPDHPFFECHRWQQALNGASAYFEAKEGELHHDGFQWSLNIATSVKAYDGEHRKIFAWLDPYIDAEKGEVVGHTMDEEADEPTIRYKGMDLTF